MNKHAEVFEVIEQSVESFQTVVKRYANKIQAEQFADMMNEYSTNGSTYYVNNLEEEWQEVARMILEENEEQKMYELLDNDPWILFCKKNDIPIDNE